MDFSLSVNLERQFHVYSDPTRDARGHTITLVFIASARGVPVGRDDAREAAVFCQGQLPSPIVFDHSSILEDYFAWTSREGLGGTLSKV